MEWHCCMFGIMVMYDDTSGVDHYSVLNYKDLMKKKCRENIDIYFSFVLHNK